MDRRATVFQRPLVREELELQATAITQLEEYGDCTSEVITEVRERQMRGEILDCLDDMLEVEQVTLETYLAGIEVFHIRW